MNIEALKEYETLKGIKFYDYTKARRIIRQLNKSGKTVKVAVLGMKEDWKWSAKTIYREGKYLRKYPQTREIRKAIKTGRLPKRIANELYGSNWATPTLRIRTETGETLEFDCFFTIKWFVSIH